MRPKKQLVKLLYKRLAGLEVYDCYGFWEIKHVDHVGTCMKLLCKMHFVYKYQNDLSRIHMCSSEPA